jgi:UDP-N-acetylglucosamine 2-epimerase
LENARAQNSSLIAIVIGTKPDFYKQAPLVREMIDNDIPAIVIDSGQHFDDRPGTVFESKSNILVPPINAAWITEFVETAMSERLGAVLKKKKQIYGQPGHISRDILSIINKHLNETVVAVVYTHGCISG